MSNEPFGFVFSGYRIINTYILSEWLSCFYPDCNKCRQFFLSVTSCAALGWQAQQGVLAPVLLFCQTPLVSKESRDYK